MRKTSTPRGRAGQALRLPLLAGALLASACGDITTPDYNRPQVGDLENSPNTTLVNAASVGMLASSRLDAANYSRYLGILGRESYYLDLNETRYVNELIAGTLNSSSFAGGGLWTNRYGTIRQGEVLIRSLDKLGPNELTEAQKEGVRGFAKTIMALDFLAIANTHKEGPINIDPDPLAPPAPLVPQQQIYGRARQLLDEAVVHLNAAGSSFSFTLPSGFTQFGLNTPAGVRRVNRGLRARTDVLMGDYANAFRLLNTDSTFLVRTAGTREELNRGAYYNFSAGSGDLVNNLTNPAPQVADTLLFAQAQRRAADTLRDDRVRIKTTRFAGRSQLGVSSFLRISLFNGSPFYGAGGQASPIPIIRNEELILLRAEAAWKTNNLTQAIDDLNWVRTRSGGLSARNDLTAANFQDALLYERRYSLMFEGWRWVDLRRFGLLDNPAYGVRGYPRAADAAPQFFPIPFGECIARGNGAEAC